MILEMTYLATPRVTLQAIFLSFPGTPDTTKELFFVLIDNGLRWSQEGWGGFTTTGVFIYINPVLNATQAVESMTPIAELSERLKTAGVTNVSLTQATFPSYLSWYRVFFAANIAAQGINMPFSSRLVPKTSFATAESRAELLAAYEAAYKITPRLIIHSVTPASYAGDGQTSMTPAWRNSVFHTTMVDTWRWNATRAEKLAGYRKVGESADHLRRITPDASYSVCLLCLVFVVPPLTHSTQERGGHLRAKPQGCVFFVTPSYPHHSLLTMVVAHWGSNYDKLLSIKNK